MSHFNQFLLLRVHRPRSQGFFFKQKGRSGERNHRPLQGNQKQTKYYHGVFVTKGKFFKTTRYLSRDIKAKRLPEIARCAVTHSLSFLSHFT